jgi:hypothetical protein
MPSIADRKSAIFLVHIQIDRDKSETYQENMDGNS